MCKEAKPVDSFYSQRKFSKEKGNYIYYVPECKECTKNKSKKWNEENREKTWEYKKKYNVTPNGKKSGSLNSKRRRDSGEMIEWQRNNKEKMKQYRENRMQNKEHNINEIEWIGCKKYFDFRCAYCGIKEDEAKKEQGNLLHKEHVICDGENDLSNCVPACRSCNSRKWIFTLEEFYNNQNDDYTEERLNRIIQWLKKDYMHYINKVL